MKITQIRNATVIIEYKDTKFLIDPVLSDKGVLPPFANSPRQERNPLGELPFDIDRILDVDAVIVTHLHPDHFDEAAKKLVPKDIKVFVQNDADYSVLEEYGFKNLEVLGEDTSFNNISLIKTKGQHGRGKILERMGKVCGVVFKHPNEKTLYVAGDTVWYEGVEEALDTHHPDIVIANAGDNGYPEEGALVMGKDDIFELYKAAPYAKIIASHMEAFNHWRLSRAELREFTIEKNFEANVLIPDDGDSYCF